MKTISQEKNSQLYIRCATRNIILSDNVIRDPGHNNVGLVTLKVLYSHLDSIGIDLFGTGYTKAELGECRGKSVGYMRKKH